MEHIRLPNEIKVNGSCYTKLEGLLCTWWRGATAAQGNKAEPLFGLDRRRLSELRIHVHKLPISDHCKILHTLAPWPDEWLVSMVDCCANVAGECASVLHFVQPQLHWDQLSYHDCLPHCAQHRPQQTALQDGGVPASSVADSMASEG